MEQEKRKRYKYSLPVIFSSTVPPMILILIGVALLGLWVGTIFGVVPSVIQGYRVSEKLGLLVGGCIFILLGGTLLTLYTEIVVTEGGINARVFIFKWVFIPWEDVLGVTTPPLPSYNDPSLWCFVQVRRLTFFHRLISRAYNTGSEPVLIINRHIEDWTLDKF